MRCERCKFENIPERTTCVRCGSVLEIKLSGVEIYPPRMPGWKKPFRALMRGMRAGNVVPEKDIGFQCPQWLNKAFDKDVAGLFLSIIPGLAHLIWGRFREVRWYFFAWVGLLLTGIFLFGSVEGFVCIGLAIGIHVRIAVQFGILKRLERLREKIVAIVLVFLAIFFVYRYTPRVVVPGLTGVYSSLANPYYKVSQGDYLLAWRDVDGGTNLPRGLLVLIKPVTLYQYGHGEAGLSGEEIVGQIVGLAGEQLEVREGVFIVDGQKLDSERYPVLQWLKGTDYSVKIPDSSYFVSAEYTVAAHGVKLDESYIQRVCLVKANDIRARVFMRWWPLLKRGFVR